MMRWKYTWMAVMAVVAVMTVGLGLWVGCAPAEEPMEEPPAEEAPEDMPMEPATATAELQGRADSGISGTVTFTEEDGVVRIVAQVQGAPAGAHGFHIHETGDCSAEDFTSTGGHFNPAGVDHAGPDAEVRHAGDLGNIVIGEDGTGTLELTSNLVTVGEGDNSVVGRGVILHEGEDDLTSQPTGAAGGRIACGVVAQGM